MSGDDYREESQTFADVLNGFSLTGHRAEREHAEPAPRPAPATRHVAPPPEEPDGEIAASVRAYTWTGGRTRSDWQLELETLVTTSSKAEALLDTLRTEHQAVARLCRRSRSVAEVGAMLSLPLGVARVLLGDMAGLGLIEVHRNPTTSNGDTPDLEVLERVLRGLTNLPRAVR
jgi:hypothetical protein